VTVNTEIIWDRMQAGLSAYEMVAHRIPLITGFLLLRLDTRMIYIALWLLKNSLREIMLNKHRC
jgi:hypothetical protein